jgi:hypothetical protein
MSQRNGAASPTGEERAFPPVHDVEKDMLGFDTLSDSEQDSAPVFEKPQASTSAFDWATDASNPYNWSKWKKVRQIVAISAAAFLACVSQLLLRQI